MPASSLGSACSSFGSVSRRSHDGSIGKSIHTPAYKELLRVLREERERIGLSQRALAERLREHYSWVAKVELGERRLDLLEFVRVCRALELDPVRALRAFLKRARA